MIVNQEMFEEGSSCYDPTPMQYQQFPEDGYPQNIVPICNPTFPMEEEQVLLSYQHQDAAAAAAVAAANTATMELELQQQMGLDNIMDNSIMDQSHLMQHPNHQIPNWENTHHGMTFNHYSQIQEMQTNCNTNINHHQNFINSTEPPYPQTPDLLNLFHLPRCSSSSLPNSTISFTNLPHSETGSGSSVLYDPMFHLNLPPPPPALGEMLHSFPNGYTFPAARNGTLFDGMEERENSGDQFDTGVLEFGRDINSLGKGKGAKNTKHFATEKQRRVHINDKYNALKALVPNPSKADRASIVEDAIQYIKELQRTLNELQGLVEKKRYSRERLMRRQKEEEESGLEVEGNNIKSEGDGEQASNGPSLRSSWLQRKSKNTEVDVRIIDDEVNIKLVQQKRINCLLFVSRVLDELQLDLQHVAGGLIGDFYSFLFNTKIYEGSSVYASAIANKVIDVVDRPYAAASQPTTSY